MRADELRDICVGLYGTWGWQTKLASELKVDPSSVRRWVSGSVPIPGPVAAAVRCFVSRKKN